ncbi:MAG: branched-chain amino acid ABC transporter permease [Actinomycetota bacterium]|nr:branched-chain amino acid ABC transporter permease [Actinomycetota bacterium]
MSSPATPRSDARPTLVDAVASRLAARSGTASPATRSRVGGAAVLAVLAALILLPFVGIHVPWVLPSAIPVLNSIGMLEVLALCFVFGSVALGYDVLFGYTGLLSFAQVLYFAIGVYVTDIALTVWHWPFLAAVLLALASAFVAAVLLGAISLRVKGIAFTMVTLAFAQAGYYLINDNPHNLTSGQTGLVMATSRLPSILVGVAHTRELYWLALAYLALAYLVVWIATESVTGRVWQAIRENEQRVSVIGLHPAPFKLASFVLGSMVAAGGGIVYLLLIGTAAPDAVASATLTVSLIAMVVLGGLGTRWGAVLGAFVYVYLQQYLVKMAQEPSFARLPVVARDALSQPQFLLGVIFILFVLFVPGGLAGLGLRMAIRRHRRSGGDAAS